MCCYGHTSPKPTEHTVTITNALNGKYYALYNLITMGRKEQVTKEDRVGYVDIKVATQSIRPDSNDVNTMAWLAI